MRDLLLYILLLFISSGSYGQCSYDSLGFQPTLQEKADVLLEWSGRDHTVYNWQIVNDLTIDGSRIIIASHEIEGDIHYGLIRLPSDSNLLSCKMPVLLYLHGGINGLFLNRINSLDNYFPVSLIRDSMIVVAPAYRNEQLFIDENTIYHSLGPSTEMDADADDAIIFLKGAANYLSIIDTTRISAIGFSRGSNVAFKVGIRTSFIKGMNIFFSATNFFDLIILEDAISSFQNFSVPDYFISNPLINGAISPYCTNSISLQTARKNMLAWSPAFFVESLPPTNLFHGTNDGTVPINQAHFIDSIINSSIPPIEDFHFYEFSNGEHSVASLGGFEPFAINLLRSIVKPTIYYSNDSLRTKGNAPSYQWYINGNPIPGEIGNKIFPSTNGLYQIEFLTGSSCSYFSDEYIFFVTDIETETKDELSFYYDYLSNSIKNNYLNEVTNSEIIISDSKGSVLYKNSGNTQFPLFLDNICPNSGIYLLMVNYHDNHYSLKFVVF